MKLVRDEKLLQKAVRELDLGSKLDLDRIKPVLCRCEKGELLSGPHIRQRYL